MPHTGKAPGTQRAGRTWRSVVFGILATASMMDRTIFAVFALASRVNTGRSVVSKDANASAYGTDRETSVHGRQSDGARGAARTTPARLEPRLRVWHGASCT